MPWCEPCGKFYNPNSLRPDGTCPNDHQVAEPPGPKAEQERAKVPWHFWLLLLALAIYLGWRVVQGIAWVVG